MHYIGNNLHYMNIFQFHTTLLVLITLEKSLSQF